MNCNFSLLENESYHFSFDYLSKSKTVNMLIHIIDIAGVHMQKIRLLQ